MARKLTPTVTKRAFGGNKRTNAVSLLRSDWAKFTATHWNEHRPVGDPDASPHSHPFCVRATLFCGSGVDGSYVVDSDQLNQWIDALANKLDGCCLNERADIRNPFKEGIASHFSGELKRTLLSIKSPKIRLVAVEVKNLDNGASAFSVSMNTIIAVLALGTMCGGMR